MTCIEPSSGMIQKARHVCHETVFVMYSMILRELHFKASTKDISTLTNRFLKNSEEPPHFRLEASFALGIIFSDQGDFEQAAEVYRQGLGIARAASAKDRAKTVESHICGYISVDYLLNEQGKTVENNLSILSGHGRTIPRDPNTCW